MYRESKDGKTTILELHKLDESVEAPVDSDLSITSGTYPVEETEPDLNKTLEITGMGPVSTGSPNFPAN